MFVPLVFVAIWPIRKIVCCQKSQSGRVLYHIFWGCIFWMIEWCHGISNCVRCWSCSGEGVHNPIDIKGEFLSISSKHSLGGSMSICLPFVGQSDGNILQNHPCEMLIYVVLMIFAIFFWNLWVSWLNSTSIFFKRMAQPPPRNLRRFTCPWKGTSPITFSGVFSLAVFFFDGK